MKRRQAVVAQLSALNLDFELIEGVDAFNTNRDQILKSYQNKLNPNPTGFLACGLSHYKIYQKIVGDKIPLSLVLEDDVILSPCLPKIIRVLDKTIQVNEIILLHAQAVHPVNITKTKHVEITDGFVLYYSMPFYGGLGSTAAYCIPLTVAQKFVDDFPISFNVDSWGPRLKNGFYEFLRIVYPYPVVPAMLPSDINYIDEKSWKYRLKMASNKISGIKHVLKYLRYKGWKKSQKQICFVNEEPVEASNYFKGR